MVMAWDVAVGRMRVDQNGIRVAVVRDGSQGLSAVTVDPEVGALGHKRHTLVLDHWHFGSVDLAQDMRRNHAVGRSIGHDGSVEANYPRQVHGDRVDFVGGHHYGDSGVVEVVE
jgi:hypothetical protein